MTVSAGPARPRAAARPVPRQRPELAHLDLTALRACREELARDESRLSYWRRIVQARLDLVRAGLDTRGTAHLRRALVPAQSRGSRRALMEVLPADDVPPLPDLAALWDREVDPGDEATAAAVVRELAAAETELSAHRAAVHRMHAEVTAELVARYRADPALALLALPLPAQGSRRSR